MLEYGGYKRQDQGLQYTIVAPGGKKTVPDVPAAKRYTVPKLYSTEGCAICDGLTANKQYQGRLSEKRTPLGQTMPWTDAQTGIRLTRTIKYICDSGLEFNGGEISHGQSTHDSIIGANNLIAFTVLSTGMKRYVLTKLSDTSSKLIESIEQGDPASISNDLDVILKNDDAHEIDMLLQELQVTQTPNRVERTVKKLVRNSKIARLIKQRQNYICEVCGREPFIQNNGEFYAEADHIKPLGLGGLDTPANMRCLCSQCHAVITHGADNVVSKLLESI